MIIRSEISACLVSRDPIDERILKSLEGFGELIIGDGSVGACGRYDAVARAKYDIIYTQDDDCLVNIEALLQLWDGNFVANMVPTRLEPCFNNNTLTGWGSLYRKNLVQVAFDKYLKHYPKDALFFLGADRIFSGLSPHALVCVGLEDLPNALAPNRLCKRPYHYKIRSEIQQRLAVIMGEP